jgi:hypothetical protein
MAKSAEISDVDRRPVDADAGRAEFAERRDGDADLRDAEVRKDVAQVLVPAEHEVRVEVPLA